MNITILAISAEKKEVFPLLLKQTSAGDMPKFSCDNNREFLNRFDRVSFAYCFGYI